MVDNDGDGFGDSNVSAVSSYAIELFDMSISGDILTVSTSDASYNYGSGTGIYAVKEVCFDSTSISFQTTSSLDPTQAYVSVSNLITGSELGYSNTASDSYSYQLQHRLQELIVMTLTPHLYRLCLMPTVMAIWLMRIVTQMILITM